MAGRKKSRSKKKRGSKARGFWSRLVRKLLLGSIVLTVIVGAVAFFWIDYTLKSKFDTDLWDIPVHIYSRSIELYPGLRITRDGMQKRLNGQGYRQTQGSLQTGRYKVGSSAIDLVTRPFTFWDGSQNSRLVRLAFSNGGIQSITDLKTGEPVSLVRLKPQLLGSMSQIQHEDRYLIRLQDAPRLLLETLVAVEDKKFTEHFGIDPKGILRSMIANIRAGRIVQGGSTLTQQLIKNVYGADERTYRRKLIEMAMAVVMDFRYDKRRILEAYCNEVFLGQDGRRAIHGFGLASQYFFGRPLSELTAPEIALLVGMIKAPSSYEPRRNPERAKSRRLVVLKVMLREGLIDSQLFEQSKAAPLGVIPKQRKARRQFATFMDAVLRQFSDTLKAEELANGNFAIFTTMDAEVQRAAEQALDTQLEKIEASRKLQKNSLEGAIIVVRPDTGEVLAMVGGRSAQVGSFNRVLDAQRPVGSLIKPIVYATAFEKKGKFTLGTVVSNRQFTHKSSDGKKWIPKNYTREYSSGVTLLEAISKSINIPTARVGLNIGVSSVTAKLKEFGTGFKGPPYPSLLLGATEFSPAEVVQFYQALANFGFKVNLRSISAIVKNDRQIPIGASSQSKEVVSSDAAYLTLYAMQEVVRSGTARGLNRIFNPSTGIAGKTGTTNDYRDSWFVGASGNYLAVVWVGRDDNKPTGLTGASGALKVWEAMMKQLTLQSFNLGSLDSIVFVETDLKSGLRGDAGCEKAQSIPYIRGTEPRKYAHCAGGRN